MDLTTLNDYAWLIGLLAAWELVWKGIALWKAARAEDKAWYPTEHLYTHETRHSQRSITKPPPRGAV